MKTKRARAAHRSARSGLHPRVLPTIEFNAFIAYADLNAARQAMSTIKEVLVASGHPYRLAPMLWRFDQLAAARWREPALKDAANANVVVLASSAPGSLPSDIEQWVTDFLARKRGSRTTLVALLGLDDAWTISIEAPVATSEQNAPLMPSFAASASVTTRAA